MDAIVKTDFNFPGQVGKYVGKVRDVYDIDGKYLVMVVSDRISAFDVVLPKGIPFKGQILNQIAAKFLDATSDILPNWKIATPDPMVTVGYKCEPYRVEMVIRGCLAGHAWREYQEGKRTLCGVALPDGMVEGQAFPEPIITPSAKAMEGHDEDITREEIIAQGIVPEAEYIQIENYTRAIFKRGQEIAAKMGLILVDTKYEFGTDADGTIILADEIHTPDSSRYWMADSYDEAFRSGGRPKSFDKDFIRSWVVERCDPYKDEIPEIPQDLIEETAQVYRSAFEIITGKTFEPDTSGETVLARVRANLEPYFTR